VIGIVCAQATKCALLRFVRRLLEKSLHCASEGECLRACLRAGVRAGVVRYRTDHAQPSAGAREKFFGV